jgi:predicted polyphosphate/ATP-dependent NAD kinase
MRKWAFIYTLEDPSEEPRVDRIGSLICVGISGVSEASAVARQLVTDGVELIELCGGFGGAGLGAVVSAVENRVPVAAVFYGVEASAGLNRIFPQGSS